MIQIDEQIKKHILSMITDGILSDVTVDNVLTTADGFSEFNGNIKIYSLVNSIEEPLTIGRSNNRIGNLMIVIIGGNKGTVYSLDATLTDCLGAYLDNDPLINSWIETEKDYAPLLDGHRFTGDYQIATNYVIDFLKN